MKVLPVRTIHKKSCICLCRWKCFNPLYCFITVIGCCNLESRSFWLLSFIYFSLKVQKYLPVVNCKNYREKRDNFNESNKASSLYS